MYKGAVSARLAWNDFITIWPTLLDANLLSSLSAEFQSNSKICCYISQLRNRFGAMPPFYELLVGGAAS